MYKDHETPRFWLTYEDAIRKYISKRLSDKTLVEDLCHDVYIKIFCYCKRFDFSCEKAGVKNLRSWVFQVCHNTVADHYKNNPPHRTIEDLAEAGLTDGTIKEDLSPALKKIIHNLPAKYALPLKYHILLNIRQADIAHKLGLSLPATKSRIQRAKKMLAEEFRKQTAA